jgi:hypothetical protein
LPVIAASIVNTGFLALCVAWPGARWLAGFPGINIDEAVAASGFPAFILDAYAPRNLVAHPPVRRRIDLLTFMADLIAERGSVAGVAVLAVLVDVTPAALLGDGVVLIQPPVIALRILGRDVVHLLEIGKEELAPRQGRDEEDARKKNDGVLHD